MRGGIPFVTQPTNQEENAWLSALRPLLSDYDVLLLSVLNSKQRNDATVAIVANPHPTALAALPNLKWVQSLWAGIEQLLAESKDSEFAIVRMVDPKLAEAVLAWTLYLYRDMPRCRTQQEARVWQQHLLLLPSERTVEVLGLDNFGKTAAERLAKQGFDVWGWGRSPSLYFSHHFLMKYLSGAMVYSAGNIDKD